MDKDLEYYLAQARRIVEHREKGATQAIRKVYKSLLDDLNHFIADEYAKYAEDDKLTYSLLQQKGEFASFLEKTTKAVEDWYPKASKQTKDLVKNVYEVCYQGMVDGVRKSSSSEELAKNLKEIRNVTPETIRRAVNNPISGLTLNDTLEKNRKEVVYDIKREIGVGLANGDRYSTMAKRITERVDMDYKKAVTIARTETHRVKEAGFHDASTEINDALKNGTTAMRLHKTWVSMKDERVRKSSKANHRKMNGVSILEDEEFDLGRGVKTQAPGQSGDPHNDINCRCFLKYELKEVEETTNKTIEKIEPIDYGTAERSTVEDELDRKAQAWVDSLSDKEKQSIELYTGPTYKRINKMLRTGKNTSTNYSDAEMKEIINSISSGIRKNRVTEPMYVYREIEKEVFTIGDVKELVGSVFKDKGFMSTSVFKPNNNDDETVVLKILVRQGAYGAYIDPVSRWKHNEYEFLLDQGTSIVFTGFENGLLQAEVIV